MAHSSRSGRPSCGLDPTMERGLGTVLRARVRHGQEQRSVRLLQGRVVAGYPARSGETEGTQARDLRATLSPLPRSARGAGSSSPGRYVTSQTQTRLAEGTDDGVCNRVGRGSPPPRPHSVLDLRAFGSLGVAAVPQGASPSPWESSPSQKAWGRLAVSCRGVDRLVPEETGPGNSQNEVGRTGGEAREGEQGLGSQFGRGPST